MDPGRQWLVCVAISIVAGVVTFWGAGGLVHFWFYRRRRALARAWKLQPDRWLTSAQSRQAFWLGNLNLTLGSIAGGTLTWYVGRGGASMLYFDAPRFGLLWLPLSGLFALLLIDAGLYYSHRMLHIALLFRHVHRFHHRFVAPTVFTTMAMHPIEFLVFTVVLALPAFIVPMHVVVYALVVAYTYLIGMIDHAGVRVRWKLPFHGNNRFHDDHHVYVHCNYGHHTTLFDRLHDTARRPS
jgi:Delta7-sterol 5-desaturase